MWYFCGKIWQGAEREERMSCWHRTVCTVYSHDIVPLFFGIVTRCRLFFMSILLFIYLADELLLLLPPLHTHGYLPITAVAAFTPPMPQLAADV